MKYEKEFKGLYQFSKRVSDIWKKQREQFAGKYKVIDCITEKVDKFRDDYIEAYEFEYIDYVLIEEVETKKQQKLSLTYFNQLFTKVVKETLIFNTAEEVAEYINKSDLKFNYDFYKVNNKFELDIYK